MITQEQLRRLPIEQYREEIKHMPTERLRQCDIYSREQEDAIQIELNKRVRNDPAPLDIHIPNHVTDNLGRPGYPTEEEVQAQIDQQIADYKKSVVPETVDEQIETVESQIQELETQVQEIKDTTNDVRRFCDYCSSKGVRHKKDCTRLNNGTPS